MTFGLSKKNWHEIERLAIRPLQANGATVWVFGSRAVGAHKPFSDIDLLFETESPLPLGFISGIRDDLENSRLPIKVDLVAIEDLAPSYADQVFTQRIKI